jgi:hypothetical protein
MRWTTMLVSLALAGCAGAPMGIKMATGAKEITVGGSVIVVSQTDGVWGATYREFLANNLYVSPASHLRRKQEFIQAIEQVSRCRVVESTLDPGAAALNAIVRC